MTYMLIQPGSEVTDPRVQGEPTYEAIRQHLGGDLEMVRTMLGTDLVLWVNEDFIGLNLPRNVVGTIVAATVDARQQPYAGPIVVTGLSDSGPDRHPVALRDDLVDSMSTAISDVRTVLGHHDAETSEFLDSATRSAMIQLAAHALTGPYPAHPPFAVVLPSDGDLAEQLAAIQRGEIPPGADVIHDRS